LPFCTQPNHKPGKEIPDDVFNRSAAMSARACPALTSLDEAGDTVRCSTLERMPKWLICVPLALQWIWLSLRYGSATLPSCANPNITAGGLVGEGKMEYFTGMGPVARAATAPFLGVRVAPGLQAPWLAEALAGARLAFPLVVKPDLGLCGYGVRRVDNMDQLLAYLAAYPAGESVVIQPYLAQEGEAGIFYARDPETDQARLIGLALRYFPRVLGDGMHSIDALVDADPRARRLRNGGKHETLGQGNRVPAPNEVVRLATIGSTRVGGLYRDGAALITAPLLNAIDAIARDMPDFYCGRFDVRFHSVDELARGVGFTIIEVNGAGSEAIEAWDPNTSLFKGLAKVFAKQRVLFAIGAAMRRRGSVPVGLAALYRYHQRQQALIDCYPPSN
jgi:hypothetical protein